MHCKNHSEVAAATRCTGCAEPFCEDCVVELAGQNYCASCKVMALGGRTLVSARATRPCKDAGTALALSIIGLFVCGLILEIFAIMTALKAKRQIAGDPQLTGSGKVTAALIIAVAGFVMGGVGLLQRIQAMSATLPLNPAGFHSMDSASSSSSPAGPAPIPPGTKCTRHPAKPAVFRCSDCGTFTCLTCDFSLAPGVHVCPACMRKRNDATRSASSPPALPGAGDGAGSAGATVVAAPLPVLAAVPAEARCVQHARVPAQVACDTCGAYMCMTCSFEAGAGIYVCPACAMAPRVELSRQRRTAMIIGFVLAVLASGGVGALLMGWLYPIYLNTPPLVAGFVERLLTFFPALAGVAVSFGAMDRRLGNSPPLVAAAVWNLILLVAYIAIVVFYTLGGWA